MFGLEKPQTRYLFQRLNYFKKRYEEGNNFDAFFEFVKKTYLIKAVLPEKFPLGLTQTSLISHNLIFLLQHFKSINSQYFATIVDEFMFKFIEITEQIEMEYKSRIARLQKQLKEGRQGTSETKTYSSLFKKNPLRKTESLACRQIKRQSDKSVSDSKSQRPKINFFKSSQTKPEVSKFNFSIKVETNIQLTIDVAKAIEKYSESGKRRWSQKLESTDEED